MIRTWYTSDMHFGHERIIELSHRLFSSVQEMDDTLVYNWNSVVAPADVVWVLGDVVMNRAALDNVHRLHGRKYLVAGNHDGCWQYHSRWRRAREWYLEAGFELVFTEGYVAYHRLGGVLGGGPLVHMAHLPYRGGGDHTATERYVEQRMLDDGRTPLLCGHVHDAWTTKQTPLGTRMINVGVDAWNYLPVPERTVLSML